MKDKKTYEERQEYFEKLEVKIKEWKRNLGEKTVIVAVPHNRKVEIWEFENKEEMIRQMTDGDYNYIENNSGVEIELASRDELIDAITHDLQNKYKISSMKTIEIMHLVENTDRHKGSEIALLIEVYFEKKVGRQKRWI